MKQVLLLSGKKNRLAMPFRGSALIFVLLTRAQYLTPRSLLGQPDQQMLRLGMRVKLSN